MRKVPGQEARHQILAYADDQGLLAERPEEMQKRLDAVDRLAGKISIKISPRKSFSPKLSGRLPSAHEARSSESRTRK
jgi:hypothetical protein